MRPRHQSPVAFAALLRYNMCVVCVCVTQHTCVYQIRETEDVMRKWYVVIVFVLLAGVLPAHRVAHASPDCRPRPEICVHPHFRAFWQENGGLDQFGNSITDLYARTIDNKTFYVQEFERARLEFMPTVDAPHNIVLGRVGAEWLDYRISELTPLTDGDGQFVPGTGMCAVVEPNTPAVCGPFLTYHQTHGAELDGLPFANRNERLRLFGLPLTPAMRWTNGSQSMVVQIFERARFEYNPADNSVRMGAVHVENTLRGVPKPIGASPTVNYLTDTGVTVLPTATSDVFRKAMPYAGFWQSQANGIKFASTAFRYHDSFYSIPAPEGKKWVTFTVLVQNNRAGGDAAAYIDRTYIAVIDLDGNRHTVATPVRYLDMPIVPSTINPGSQMVGQMLVLIPKNTGVAQVEFQIANMDQYVSRFYHVMEIRVEPITY